MTNGGVRTLTGWVGMVLNAPDAQQLAYFYRDLFGWPLADDSPGWCTMQIPQAPANLAFQDEENYQRSGWVRSCTPTSRRRLSEYCWTSAGRR